MALAFFLFGCREELDYVNSENSLQNSDSFTKDNVVTKKLFKQDYLSNSFLKQNVEAVNNFLKQKGSSSSAALSKNSTIEGVEVYTDVFEEVDYLNAKYYSFHIAGSSSKEFEQKLVLKYVNNEIKDRYILKYKRLSDLKIDPNSYQLEKLIGSSDGNGNSLLMYIDTFTLGCTTFTVTTFNCGHQGNHSNGQYCSVEKTYIPHDIISAQYNPNCNSEGGGSPLGSTTGDSGSQGSQNTNGDNSPAFLSIYSSAPYYEIEFVPHTNKLLNYLNLNPTEITQINANDNLRLQIYLYLQNLGLYPFTPYLLGDEYAEVSILSKFTLKYFNDNPTSTWEQLLPFLSFAHQFLQENPDAKDYFLQHPNDLQKIKFSNFNPADNNEFQMANSMAKMVTEYLIADKNGTTSSLQNNWIGWNLVKEAMKSYVKTNIVLAVKLGRWIYEFADAYFPALNIPLINLKLAELKAELAFANTFNTNPNTMQWKDIVLCWLFEYGNFPVNTTAGYSPIPTIGFAGTDYVISGIPNQLNQMRYLTNHKTLADGSLSPGSINFLRSEVIKQIKLGNLNTYGGNWGFGFDAMVDTIKELDGLQYCLGSYQTTVHITSLGNSQYKLTFIVRNKTGWESGTRGLNDYDGDSTNDSIIPDKPRGQGIHLGGTIGETFGWYEIITIP